MSTRPREPQAMLERLGDVLYWAACLFAALIIAILVQIAYQANWVIDYIFASVFVALAVLVWLIGRACRYVLSGR